MANWLRQGLRQTQKQYLPVRIAYSDANVEAEHVSYACHKSQYTPEEIDEILLLLGHVLDGTVYLRPWFGDTDIVTDLFD